LQFDHAYDIIRHKEKEETKMKLVINTTFGRFCLPDEFCELHGLDRWDSVLRNQPELVSYVEARGQVPTCVGKLEVVEIPEEATDWELDEYDGLESITYVVDGKLHHIS
jgi:hypothetical protein